MSLRMIVARGRWIGLMGLCLGVLSSLGKAAGPTKTVFWGGRVVSLDPLMPYPEAVVVAGERIVYVGDAKTAIAQTRRGDRLVHLRGQLLLPGFVEAHGHLLSLGRTKVRLNLAGISSPSHIVELVAHEAARRGPAQWVLGRGWDQNLWDPPLFPADDSLSLASPHNPVKLSRIDGHAGWYNRYALDMAGISAATPDPDGGRILRRADGTPTGVLVDRAMDLVDALIPEPSYAEDREAIEGALASLISQGITSFHDAGIDGRILAIYKELLAEGRLPVRIHAMLSGAAADLVEAYLRTGPQVHLGGGYLTVRSIKLMADGALGSRGAALLEPYSDEPDDSGSLILDEEALETLTSRALAAGLQVAIHAIGDRANRVVLAAYAKALQKAKPTTPPRLRVEHAQVVHPDDLQQYAALGVILSVQPTHGTSDMPWAISRLGEDRIRREAYLWRSLQSSGAVLAFGSDTPIESENPIAGLYAAVFRQDRHGQPAEGWNPSERLALIDALRAYTVGGAYAAFEEETKGLIKKGYWADLVVLDQDLFTLSRAEFLATKVVLTMIGGTVWTTQAVENRSESTYAHGR